MATTAKMRRAFPATAEVATLTLTRDQAAALLSGVGVALKYEEVPDGIADSLYEGLMKFDAAFGFGFDKPPAKKRRKK